MSDPAHTMTLDNKHNINISVVIKNEWADNRAQRAVAEHKSPGINKWQQQRHDENRAVRPLSVSRQRFSEKPAQDTDSSTFDKNLSEGLLLADHALVRRVIRQAALVDSEGPLVAHALEHIPGPAAHTKETNNE